MVNDPLKDPYAKPAHETPEHQAARLYAKRGLAVFPLLSGNKAPATTNGVKDATVDIAQIDRWFTDHTDVNVGIAIPPHVVVVDVDPRNGGMNTIEGWCEAHGDEWFTAPPRSFTGGSGFHLWFKRPEGRLRKNPGLGVDLLWEGRYVVAPPSTTAAPYEWQLKLPDALPDDLPAMEPWLIELSQAPDREAIEHTLRPPERSGEDELDVAAHRYIGWPVLLRNHDWTLVRGDGESDGSRWRRPGSDNDFSATMKYGCLFNYSTGVNLPITEHGDPRGITLYSAIAHLEHDGDMKRTAAWLRTQGFLPRQMIDVERGIDEWLREEATLRPPLPGPSPAPVLSESTVCLPEAFWAARPAFQHIRKAAHAKLIGADGVLAAVLMRVAAHTPFQVMLPDIIGRYGSLNGAAICVGPPGIGKGSALDCAERLLPSQEVDRYRELPVGSGEGMTKAYFEKVSIEDENGKKHLEWQQVYDAILFRVDEGDVLKSLMARSGQTTVSTFRSAWSGEQLGGTYADVERRGILLPAHQYRAAFVFGIQPENAHYLFEDAAGGTPQRFLWFSLVDPSLPDIAHLPEWPGTIEWIPPQWNEGSTVTLTLTGGGWARRLLQIDPDVQTILIEDRHAVVRGTTTSDTLDAHANLLQLKTAGLLAIFNGRLEVTVEDWDLAGMIVETSGRVRAWVQQRIRDAADVAELEAIEKHQRRTTAGAAASMMFRDDVSRVAAVLVRHARKQEDGLPSWRLKRSLTSKDRPLFEAALDMVVKQGWLVLAGDQYVARMVDEDDSTP